MPVVSVRITTEQKRRLAKRGNVSETIRDAVRQYLDEEEAQVVSARLRTIQRENRLETTSEEIVRMIGEDRARDSR